MIINKPNGNQAQRSELFTSFLRNILFEWLIRAAAASYRESNRSAGARPAHIESSLLVITFLRNVTFAAARHHRVQRVR